MLKPSSSERKIQRKGSCFRSVSALGKIWLVTIFRSSGIPDSQSIKKMNLFLRTYRHLPPLKLSLTLPLKETTVLLSIGYLTALIIGEHLEVEPPPAKSKTTYSSYILRMYILEFLLLFYSCDCIKLVLTPQTNNHLSHGDMEFSEFLRFVGCWIYMALFEGVTDRRIGGQTRRWTCFKEHQVGSLNTCPSIGLMTSSTTCHKLIRIYLRTMTNYSTCVIWKIHGMQTRQMFLNLPGLAC